MVFFVFFLIFENLIFIVALKTVSIDWKGMESRSLDSLLIFPLPFLPFRGNQIARKNRSSSRREDAPRSIIRSTRCKKDSGNDRGRIVIEQSPSSRGEIESNVSMRPGRTHNGRTHRFTMTENN